jgi:hypothetical protein
LEKTLPTASSNIKLGQPTDVDIWTTDTGKAFYVVTDRASSCVDIFDFSTDEFVIQFGNTGSTTAKVDFPYCSAGVDGTSTIFIADSNNRRIAAYNVSVDSPNDDNTDDKPVGSSEVEIKFTSISMTNLVVSLSGVDPMGYYMLDCKEKLTDTWVSALKSNIYVPASQSDFPILNNSYVGSNETFEISGILTESAGIKQYSLEIPISIFVEQNDAANIDSSFFRFRRVAQ